MKLRSKKFWRCSSKLSAVDMDMDMEEVCDDVEWEIRPGGMLVQKRDSRDSCSLIRVRVSTGSDCHEISIGANATFGEMKKTLSMITDLEPQEQRLLFRGKEREDGDFLHMVGVKNMDKVLLLEDPAKKERKLQALRRAHSMDSSCTQAIVV